MTTYSPGAGLKKPMNMLDNPVYPDIKKGPPRFVWSRKHWNVDVGATIRDTEPFTQFVEPAVLAQSRSYNQTVYGQSSHRDIVNAEFRPPLLNYYEDIGPLSRVPATIHAIIPRINPGTAGHDAGTSGYAAKNERTSDVVGALTDRIKTKEWRPTFYAPMDIPQDNSILPDLEAKLPSISVHAGWNIPVYISPQPREPDMGDDKLSAPIHPGYTSQVYLDGPSGYENYTSEESLPYVSASAGVNTPVYLDGPVTHVENFAYNRPQVSASAGVNTPVKLDAETRVGELYYNRPQVSATAGMNTPINIDAETRVDDLETKLGGTLVQVLNPGSENGYKEQVTMYSNPEDNIQDKRPTYSYVVPSEVPVYRERNEQTNQPYFREKIQVPKSYGQISQSGGFIPRSGVEQPGFDLGGRMHKRVVPQRKQPRYRF